MREELQKHFTSLGIPLEAVIFTVRGRAYSLIMPPVFESTGEDSNRRRRELSWLAAGHRVHLPGSTAASLLKPSILW